MDDRQRTLAAVTIIIGFFVLVIIVVGAFFFGRKIISPVPDDGAIRIIFVTPTPPSTPTPSLTPTLSPSSPSK